VGHGAVEVDRVTGTNRESIVYATSDAGLTWTKVMLPSSIGAELAPPQSIDEVDCDTTFTCVILGIPAGVSEAGVNQAILTNAVPTSYILNGIQGARAPKMGTVRGNDDGIG
jgi:hypothetical protein